MSQRKAARQEGILSELQAQPAARLGELAASFAVSKETIRRDIAELSARGLVARTYGGAFPVSLTHEPGLGARAGINPEGRRRMAEVAERLIRDCSAVMIDTGATMARVCERLAAAVPEGGTGLTVITNGLRNAAILSDNPAIRILVCPGAYDPHEVATFGPLTLEFVGRFRADAFLTSSGGLDATGAMDPNSDAAAVKRAMLQRAGRSIFVVEHRKFGFVQFETVCGLDAIDVLVTDRVVEPEMAEVLERHGVEVEVG
jgi:DeoR/GlpR family transcriptional regulator of sugar metabolism